MDPRKKDVERLDAETAALEARIASECVEIGRALALLDRARFRNPELLKFLRSADGLVASAEGFRADIARVRDLDRHAKTLDREAADERRRREKLLAERSERLVELGAGSFALFGRLADKDPWRPIFEEVLKFDAESERRRQELTSIEEKEAKAGFFGKLRWKTRKFMLRGELSRIDRDKSAAYGRAGEKAEEAGFGKLAEGPLRQLYDALGERRRAAAEAAAAADRKASEAEGCRAELKRLEADADPETRVKEIERRIEGLARELGIMHGWAGQVFVEADLRPEAADSALSARYEIVAGLRGTIAERRRESGRLRAELEIESIRKVEKEKRARRRALDDERLAREREIAALDVEINAGLKRIEELGRVAAGEAPYREPAPPAPPAPPRPS
jgi:hypothetical protein